MQKIARLLIVVLIVTFSLLALIFATQPVQPAYAATTITVNTTDDESNADSDCSLREAVETANSGAQVDSCTDPTNGAPYSIIFSVNGTITLSSTLPISTEMTIDGAGQSVTVSGNNTVRVMYVHDVGTLNLNALTIADGFINASNEHGGGIVNYGTLDVRNSTFSGNSAASESGGAINNRNIATISNSTFSGNSASTAGGGLYNYSGSLTISNSTISSNNGGGISILYDAVALTNTIVAANLSGSDCVNLGGGGGGAVNADSYNMDSDGTCDNATTQTPAQLSLGPLADNGGDTQTIALLVGSTAIDAGDDATCAASPVDNLDQRGTIRPFGSHCDIGSFEVVNDDFADVAIAKAVTPTSAVPGEAITYTLAFSNTGPGVAYGVVVSDSVPLSVTVSGVTSSILITQTSSSPDFAWALSDLAVGAGGVITLTGVISVSPASSLAGQIITNTAVITATNDITGSNNSAGAAPYRLCGPGSYVDTTTNLCMLAPPGRYVPAFGYTFAPMCEMGAYQPDSGKPSCLLAPINAYVDVTGATDFTACPSGTFNPTQGATSAAACISLSEALTVVKSVDNATPRQGDTVFFTVAVSNSSSISLTDATLSDTLPAGLSFLAGSADLSPPQGSAILAADAGDLPILASGLTITDGASVTVTFQASVGLDTAGSTLINTVELNSPQMNPAFTDTASLTVVTPQVSISVSPDSVDEDGTAGLVYSFTRTAGTFGPLSINFDVGGAATFATDFGQTGAASFDAVSGTATIPDGAIGTTVTLTPSADALVEPDEDVVLTIVGGSGYGLAAGAVATGTIRNDDGAALSIDDVTAIEGDSGTTAFVFTVALNGNVGGGFTVDYATADGTAQASSDYASAAGSLTFVGVDGETQTVTVNVNGDTDGEVDEGFSVLLTNLQAGALAVIVADDTGIGIIENDDDAVLPAISLTASPARVDEDGVEVLVFTLSRTGLTVEVLTVDLAVGGTAMFDDDYTVSGAESFSASLATAPFAGGSASVTITVDPKVDTTVEIDETVILSVVAGSGYGIGTPASATATITNDDPEAESGSEIYLPIIRADD